MPIALANSSSAIKTILAEPERSSSPLSPIREAARCPYHQADWRNVAALSVAVLARVQEGQRQDKAIKAIAIRFNLDDRDEVELFSLFADPIHWGFGTDELGNGQHRVCALKKADAEFCIVAR